MDVGTRAALREYVPELEIDFSGKFETGAIGGNICVCSGEACILGCILADFYQ